MSNERVEIIENVVAVMNSLCNKCNIELIPKELKNKKLAVVIHDKTTGKEYVMVKSKGSD